MPKKIDVSIVVATKNEAHNLATLLESIKRQSGREKVETIVVDNFSTDETRNIAKNFGVKIYKAGNERSRQRNIGAKKASGQFLLFVDADMVLPRSIISECVLKFKNKNICALIAPEITPETSFFSKVKKLEKMIYENEPLIEAPRIFRRSDFIAVHGYDENLIAGEDWDLGYRIKTQGSVARISSKIEHNETSFLRNLRHKKYYAYNISRYQILYPQKFAQQSGISRIRLFWRKRSLLRSNPLPALGLIVLKSIEYLVFLIHKRD